MFSGADDKNVLCLAGLDVEIRGRQGEDEARANGLHIKGSTVIDTQHILDRNSGRRKKYCQALPLRK